MLARGSDEDDDDMFIMGGGTAAAVSIFSAKAAADDNDDDDDDDDDADDDIAEVPAQKRRGRPKFHDLTSENPKESKGASKKSSQSTRKEGKSGPVSVFDIVSDDEEPVLRERNLITISDDDEDDTHLRATAAIARARHLLNTEELIERQAEEFAKQEAEEKARAEEALRKLNERENSTKPQASSASDDLGLTAIRKKGKPITFKVRCGEDSIKMKILTTDPLLKMLAPFCKRFSLNLDAAVMEVDGEEVEEGDTAETYDLEDNTIIDIRLRKA